MEAWRHRGGLDRVHTGQLTLYHGYSFSVRYRGRVRAVDGVGGHARAHGVAEKDARGLDGVPWAKRKGRSGPRVLSYAHVTWEDDVSGARAPLGVAGPERGGERPPTPQACPRGADRARARRTTQVSLLAVDSNSPYSVPRPGIDFIRTRHKHFRLIYYFLHNIILWSITFITTN